jgi:hypothetical protein
MQSILRKIQYNNGNEVIYYIKKLKFTSSNLSLMKLQAAATTVRVTRNTPPSHVFIVASGYLSSMCNFLIARHKALSASILSEQKKKIYLREFYVC